MVILLVIMKVTVKSSLMSLETRSIIQCVDVISGETGRDGGGY